MKKTIPWWSKKYGKDKVCGISFTRLRQGKNKNGMSYVITLPCSHSFYRYNIVKWTIFSISQTSSCPICRTSYDLEKVFSNK